MGFNTIVIILNQERKELITNALAAILSNKSIRGFTQDMFEPYEALLERVNDACDELILTSHTGAVSCLCYALTKTNDETAKKLASEIRRINKQAEMCKKHDYLTCTLNLDYQISTKLTYN